MDQTRKRYHAFAYANRRLHRLLCWSKPCEKCAFIHFTFLFIRLSFNLTLSSRSAFSSVVLPTPFNLITPIYLSAITAVPLLSLYPALLSVVRSVKHAHPQTQRQTSAPAPNLTLSSNLQLLYRFQTKWGDQSILMKQKITFLDTF